MVPLEALLQHHPLPELAGALRKRVGEITRVWTETVERSIPRMKGKSFDELKDNVHAILEGMARALAARDNDEIAELVRQSPAQGLTRFRQDYTVTEIMQEDRLLRAVIVTEVEEELGRGMDVAEAASLHGVVDVMLQRAVVALVEEQQAELREAAERELKYLSFLSHDMNNSLNGVLLTLHMAMVGLTTEADRVMVAAELRAASESIEETIGGMRQMLEYGRLRGGAVEANEAELDLGKLIRTVAARHAREAKSKGLALVVDVPGGLRLRTGRQLLTMMLQNLVGNAVKYTLVGGVRLTAGPRAGRAGWVEVCIGDTGPGIPAEGREALFEAFRRGEGHRQPGLGLGLAIASQAAGMLGAELTMESELGVGTRFLVMLASDGAVGAGNVVRETEAPSMS